MLIEDIWKFGIKPIYTALIALIVGIPIWLIWHTPISETLTQFESFEWWFKLAYIGSCIILWSLVAYLTISLMTIL